MSTRRIGPFTGEHRFLSNFFPVEVYYDETLWSSAEHAYQAAKTFDSRARAKIFHAQTAGQAKRLGRKVPLRSDWNEVQIPIMLAILRAKFADPWLAERLLFTGDAELVEVNSWGDRFWGQVWETRAGENRQGAFIGQNHLGKLLMQVRRELREGHGE